MPTQIMKKLINKKKTKKKHLQKTSGIKPNNRRKTYKMETSWSKLKNWVNQEEMYVFSGCVEEKYPAIKQGLLNIGELFGHKMHTYSNQSCCSGPLTKMGLGNKHSLSSYTQANLDLRRYNEQIMITSCNGCYSYMIKSNRLKTDVDSYISDDSDSAKINNFPLLLHSIEYISMWAEEIRLKVKYPIKGLKFVSQYGCHYLNQYKLSMEHSFRNLYAEHKKIKGWAYNSIPTYLTDITRPMGAKIVPYSEYTLCCGGSTPQRQINLDTAKKVAMKKFDSIHIAEPDAILTICPLCMYFMEDCQLYPELTERYDRKIPIIHINELLSLMLGNDQIINQIIKSHKINIEEFVDTIIID
ncbi:MAG: hypothetical protein GF364_20225 [Candidatus Lokiarchaeota archaeon]|nr:hypothetical protein [Candidatus Lokiarchaeota archaeon]